jgi:hypothetical protein
MYINNPGGNAGYPSGSNAHGGGEGRQGIGQRRGPKTREGKQAFGVRTRTPKKYSNVFIVTRRKSKRDLKGLQA